MEKKLVNAQWMARRFPETFEIPSQEELDKLVKGDIVKICYYDETGSERFWVKITDVDGDKIQGTCDNNLINSKIPAGGLIEFKKVNVLSIWQVN